MRRPPMTVIESLHFLRDSEAIFEEDERSALVGFLGEFPEAGAIVPGAGGIRKLRWALPGMGKRGGARVIYYFHNERMPLILLTVYAKSAQANLSVAERNRMKLLVPKLVENFSKL